MQKFRSNGGKKSGKGFTTERNKKNPDNTFIRNRKKMKFADAEPALDNGLKKENEGSRAKRAVNDEFLQKKKEDRTNWKRKREELRKLERIPASSSSEIENSISHSLNLDKVTKNVSVLLKKAAIELASKKTSQSLFMDEAKPVHMIVECIKVPIVQNKNLRFHLPHRLIDSSSEVCLFVKNLVKDKHVDFEPTIEHYKNVLDENKITGISRIVPLRQLETEYDRFELKRRLVSQFDMLLADGRIIGHVVGHLGNEVYKRRKMPFPVDMRIKNLKAEFEKTLNKTCLMLHGRGDKSAVKVGHTKQSCEQMAENIMAVAEGLAKIYPGGWNNIRCLRIVVQGSTTLPIYISLKNSNEVPVPVVKFNTPKKAVPIEGELTTVPGARVIVMPGGEVIVKKEKLSDEDIEMGLGDSDLEGFDLDDEMKVDVKPKVEPKKEMKSRMSDSKEEEEEEEEEKDDDDDAIAESEDGDNDAIAESEDGDDDDAIAESEDGDDDAIAESEDDGDDSIAESEDDGDDDAIAESEDDGDDDAIAESEGGGDDDAIAESEDDGEKNAEAAENAYLNKWMEQRIASIEERNRKRKIETESEEEPIEKKQKDVEQDKKKRKQDAKNVGSKGKKQNGIKPERKKPKQTKKKNILKRDQQQNNISGKPLNKRVKKRPMKKSKHT